jgi:uncharacterized membrane protein YphA (DoxX/SURF4 family)
LVYRRSRPKLFGGAMLASAIQTRWVALALPPILIGAVLLVHGDRGRNGMALKTIMPAMSMVAALSAAHSDERRNAGPQAQQLIAKL